jgi:hypothetical protein
VHNESKLRDIMIFFKELREWIQRTRPILSEASHRIFNLVLHNNVRINSFGSVDEFANKMYSEIIKEFDVDRSTESLPLAPPPPKRQRGRPKKTNQPCPSVEEELWPSRRTRTQTSHMSELLAAPAFTTSPVKSTPQKVRRPRLFSDFQPVEIPIEKRSSRTRDFSRS